MLLLVHPLAGSDREFGGLLGADGTLSGAYEFYFLLKIVSSFFVVLNSGGDARRVLLYCISSVFIF